MLMIDPRKAAAAIVRKRKPQADSMPQPSELLHDTDGELDPRHMAAEDVMAAFHSKDVGHLKTALANFHDLHMFHKELEEQKGPRDEEDLSMESDRPEL